jgi:filamentous hemagglutinin
VALSPRGPQGRATARYKSWLPASAQAGTFTAPGGLSVQIAEGDFKSQINTFGAQPGMGYLNELTTRTDVNWQPVKLAHDQWDFKQEGLTPAGAALLSVAVAWATGGMANAAFTSLASTE